MIRGGGRGLTIAEGMGAGGNRRGGGGGSGGGGLPEPYSSALKHHDHLPSINFPLLLAAYACCKGKSADDTTSTAWSSQTDVVA